MSIRDTTIRTAAKVRSFDKSEALLQYLKTLDTELPEKYKFPPRHSWHHRGRNEYQSSRRYTNYNESWKHRQGARPASQGTQQNKRPTAFNKDKVCYICNQRGHIAYSCPNKKQQTTEKRAYMNFGSSCITITRNKVEQLALKINTDKHQDLQGYGNGIVKTLGVINVSLCVNKIVIDTETIVVPDQVQTVPVIIGQPFTQHPRVIIIKDYKNLHIMEREIDLPELNETKTKKSPSQLLLGYIPRTAIERILTDNVDKQRTSKDLLPERGEASENIRLEQLKSKERYDAKRIKPPIFALGDTVVVEKPIQRMEGSKKLAPIYDGLMKIMDVLDNNRYAVRDTREGYRKKKYESVYSVDKMKKYSLESDSDIAST
ncbi:hypothetical protein CBL_20954 [Carabus blaptoides fortunei]